MAIINGIYIHVVSENVSHEVDGTSHPVESGIPTTDTVKPKALSISLSGKIVDYGNMTAEKVIAQIKSWQNSGSLIEFRGRNKAESMQIRSFEPSYSYSNSGGADFSMSLVQVRIAKSAYVPKKASTTEQETAAKNDTTSIKVGSIVVFKGGPVYVSSDATKAAATRSRSTCRVTKISMKSWSIHQYHLISTDGGRVYGWVDLKNIESKKGTSTSGTTNAGTQQVRSSTFGKTKVFHPVKKGDTVWKLVTERYKNVDASVSEVIRNNANCFSRKGDATTLQIGTRLFIGYK